MIRTIQIAALSLTLVAGSALAHGSHGNRGLSADLANRIAVAGVEACAASGFNVATTVVDASGNVLAMVRNEAAGPHTIEASRMKAYTSASARNATSAMLEVSQSNPGAANLGDIPGFLLLGGGVPIQFGGNVVGAVGIGGAPGGHLDEQCALEALDNAGFDRR